MYHLIDRPLLVGKFQLLKRDGLARQLDETLPVQLGVLLAAEQHGSEDCLQLFGGDIRTPLLVSATEIEALSKISRVEGF